MFKPKKNRRGHGKTRSADQQASSLELQDSEDSFQNLKERKFPGPVDARAALRVSMKKEAFSSIVSHAQSSLEREICGVLVGDAFRDEAGPFLVVDAVIAGKAQEGATHVTFTQETWNDIYQQLDEKYPKKSIVGWYHSHPGFGVTFSEMDLFIQKNFFSSATQIALVTDPLKNQTAVIYNSASGIQYLDRFWIERHEQSLQCPIQPAAPESPATSLPSGSSLSNQAIEDRLGQTLQAIDDLNNRVSSYLYLFIFIIGLGFIGLVGFWGYTQIFERRSPPELMQYYPVPVDIEGEPVMLGVGVYKWPLPDKLVSQFAEEERKLYEAQLERMQALELEILERARKHGLKVEDLLNDEAPASDTSTKEANDE
ncbi:Mov34/MPN/PAD-1 family protein [Pelagicoccus enzymogenes]|uniref:Mov34/MPN/PAD-1 family protein n=1 Tax=Pelagicoccus enzymogenes TaxID=2773457 RepID=UPI00280D3967|nr:Mov34/MPN/PAD-1 family protein [Pelagicoccus enzymogenes]MDQ8200983.1 Mov34/MPN/PAD-1 family protein [Pelagicoccus enzymogenes]